VFDLDLLAASAGAASRFESRSMSQEQTTPSRPPEYLNVNSNSLGIKAQLGLENMGLTGAHRMPLSGSTASPFTPSLWPLDEELAKSRTMKVN
jgi:hypothetical protein